MRTLSLGLTAASMVFVLTACGGDKDETASDSGATTDTITGGTTETGETGSAPSNGISQLTMDLFVGIDASGNTIPVMIDGYEQPSMLIINLGTAAWSGDPASTTQYCSILYFLDGRSNVLTSPDSGYWYGIDNVDVNDASTDCDAFDPDFSADYIGEFASYAYTIRLGGTIDPEIVDLGLDPADYFGADIATTLLGETDNNLPSAALLYEAPGGDVTLNADGSGVVIPPGNAQSQTGIAEGYIVAVIPWSITFQ